jgi:DNA polymerase elongation subunit (family B)
MRNVVLTDEIKEYIKVRFEQIGNVTYVAEEIIKKFGVNSKPETFRRMVGRFIQDANLKKQNSDIKRLFFDIETSYYLVPTFQFWKVNINPDNILREKKIICVSYKWQYEDKVHVLKWDEKNQDDTKLVKDFIQVIKHADELIAHNGDKFDIKELRTRAILTGNLMFPIYRTLDTLKKARQYFRFPSNKLAYLGKALKVGRKLDHEGMKLWIDICEHNDKEALKRMLSYCVQDVILLEEVYLALSPYIYHNTNMAVLKGGEKWHCPECASNNVQLSHTDATAMGYIKRHMKCNSCRKFYKISNRTYLKMLEFTLMHSKDANT